jgi:hypothetical protein
MKKNKEIISNCCSAPVKTENGCADFDDYSEGQTCWYVCTRCKEPCDIKLLEK